MEPIPIHNPFPGAGCFLVARTGSTQEEARRLARIGFPPGSLVAAEAQTEGRGRFPERSWLAESGLNLLFTLFLEPAAASIPAFPLRVGAALCRAVTIQAIRMGARFPSPPRVKWPNDLLLGDRKVAGVLCEAGSTGTFVGIGLNCNQLSFPPELREKATSLALELGREVERWAILEIFLDLLKQALGDPDWLPGLEELLWKKDKEVSFRPGLPGQNETIHAVLEGLGSDGSLILRTARGGALSFAAGELLLPLPAAELTGGEASYKVGS